jgi:hypothetical protein
MIGGFETERRWPTGQTNSRRLTGRQPESQWLDAKQQPWRLGTPEGNAELAKDLSAMANAQGGLILIPARTTMASGREIIDSVGDLPGDLVGIKQIRDVLKQWVFPPLPDLVTELVPTREGRGRLVVAVGAHRPDNSPHLVVGTPQVSFPITRSPPGSVTVMQAARSPFPNCMRPCLCAAVKSPVSSLSHGRSAPRPPMEACTEADPSERGRVKGLQQLAGV